MPAIDHAKQRAKLQELISKSEKDEQTKGTFTIHNLPLARN